MLAFHFFFNLLEMLALLEKATQTKNTADNKNAPIIKEFITSKLMILLPVTMPLFGCQVNSISI